MPRRNLIENLFRSGSGSGLFQKSDPDPVQNRQDPQHCLQQFTFYRIKRKNNIRPTGNANLWFFLNILAAIVQYGWNQWHALWIRLREGK
jgi:hypothetical protein